MNSLYQRKITKVITHSICWNYLQQKEDGEEDLMRWWRKGEKRGDNFDKVNDVKNNNLFYF